MWADGMGDINNEDAHEDEELWNDAALLIKEWAMERDRGETGGRN